MSRSLKYRTGETKTIRIPKMLEAHVQQYVTWLDQVVADDLCDLLPDFDALLAQYLLEVLANIDLPTAQKQGSSSTPPQTP